MDVFSQTIATTLVLNIFYTSIKPRAYRLQRRRGHVTAIVLCVPSKIQVRQWFVTNYSNISCLDCTMHIVEELYYF